MAYTQPKLGFELDALEPYLDKENLDVHYNKHHVTYINNYNKAVEGTEYQNMDIEDVLRELNDVPEDKKLVLTNQGGGAWNHSFFWSILTPANNSGSPGENTLAAIEEAFESFDKFKELFTQAAVSVFGSGWAWLVVNQEGKLEIVKTQNQVCPLSNGQKPILTLDVWEHAYYLKYKNLRADYIKAFFNVINWQQVENYYTSN